MSQNKIKALDNFFSDPESRSEAGRDRHRDAPQYVTAYWPNVGLTAGRLMSSFSMFCGGG